MMNVDYVKDLIGKECIALEAGEGVVAKLIAVWADGEKLFAELEIAHSTVIEMNRMREHGEPAIAGWHEAPDRLGKRLTIMQAKQNVFRGPDAYLQFSSPYGGTRLLFLDEYIEKMHRQDADGWEWDEIIGNAGAKFQ